MASTEVDKTSEGHQPAQGVDPQEEPSVDWGWHGGFPKGTQIAGWFSVFALLMMILTNHSGVLNGGSSISSAEFWMMGIAAGMVVGLIYDLRRRRAAWRR